MSFRKIFPYVIPAVVVLLVMGTVGWVLYSRATAFMTDALRTYLSTSASLAAQQFDHADILAVTGPKDMEKPAYRELVTRLRTIRDGMPSARFAYIYRKTEHPLQ